MFEKTLHHPFAEAFGAMIGMDDNIAQPGERGVIGDAADKADLLSIVEQAEADGVADGLFDHRARTIIGPISGVKQGADGIEVEPARIVGEQVIVVSPFAGWGGRFLHAEHVEASDAL